MIEEKGDIFGSVTGFNVATHAAPWIVIPTNAECRADGRAVMGAGVALKASVRWFWLARELGDSLRRDGQRVVVFDQHAPVADHPNSARRVVAFPTKTLWRRPSDLELVAQSAEQLRDAYREAATKSQAPFRVLLPRVGSGLGGLAWSVVRDKISSILADDVFVVRTP